MVPVDQLSSSIEVPLLLNLLGLDPPLGDPIAALELVGQNQSIALFILPTTLGVWSGLKGFGPLEGRGSA